MKFGSELARGLSGPQWRGGRGPWASLGGRGSQPRPLLCGPRGLQARRGPPSHLELSLGGLVRQVAGEPRCPSRCPQSRVMLVTQLGRHVSREMGTLPA